MVPLIEAVDVSKRFAGGLGREGTLALAGLSLAIHAEKPSIIAVVGESGSGKTTLARLLLGLAEPSGGLVRYRGSDLRKLRRDERLAFWLNAYNALVLRTVVDHYPIQARSKEYPPKSIRQIPGAFERLSHRVGGSSLTLDQIEQNILPDFHDPRVYLALGRGAVGGGRLRSEAFTPERLEAQLTEVANECATRPECIHIDRENNKVSVSAIFSWREKDFTSAYAGTVPSVFSNRSPIERAVIGLVGPKLLTIEKDFLDKNTFQLAYAPFDWTLNDLTGRGGR